MEMNSAYASGIGGLVIYGTLSLCVVTPFEHSTEWDGSTVKKASVTVIPLVSLLPVDQSKCVFPG